MSIYKQIMNIIQDYQEKECGQYYYNELIDEEFCIEDVIEDIFKKNNIMQYTLSIEEMFKNLGCTIYSISVVWIENNELRTILNKRLIS